MSDLYLLGAGASVEAGIPDSYRMSQRIAETIRSKSGPKGSVSDVLSFVIGGLMFQRGIEGADPFDGVDVESLFNAVILLADRAGIEAAPFIGSWHPTVEQLDRAQVPRNAVAGLHAFVTDTMQRQLKNAIPSSAGAGRMMSDAVQRSVADMLQRRSASMSTESAFAKALQTFATDWANKARSHSLFGADGSTAIDAIRQIMAPGTGSVFRKTAEQMIQALIDIAWTTDPSKVEYLAPLISRAKGSKKTVIATLNYDNSIELAAKSHGIEVATGIEEWSGGRPLSAPADGVTLLKLHGSIDWCLEKGGSRDLAKLPQAHVRRASNEELSKKSFRPAVIFGQRNKLTAEGPYLELLRVCVDWMHHCSRLVVIGYSFRDPHINEYISRWLNSDSGRVIVVIAGPDFAKTSVPYAQQLIRLGSRCQVIPDYAGAAIKQFVED